MKVGNFKKWNDFVDFMRTPISTEEKRDKLFDIYKNSNNRVITSGMFHCLKNGQQAFRYFLNIYYNEPYVGNKYRHLLLDAEINNNENFILGYIENLLLDYGCKPCVTVSKDNSTRITYVEVIKEVVNTDHLQSLQKELAEVKNELSETKKQLFHEKTRFNNLQEISNYKNMATNFLLNSKTSILVKLHKTMKYLEH